MAVLSLAEFFFFYLNDLFARILGFVLARFLCFLYSLINAKVSTKLEKN